MKPTSSRKAKQVESWPRRVMVGRETITVYRHRTPLDNFGYLLANYWDGQSRFDSCPTEAEALEAAIKLARQLSPPATRSAPA